MKKMNFLILLILPLLFLFLNILCRENLYFSNFYDPSYVYLINSLNLSQLNGYGVGHIDHPGTPVQMIGSIVILIFSISKEDIVLDVFNNPEFYLSSISSVIALINALSIFTLGIVSYIKFKDLNSALILQLTPFFSTVLYNQVPRVNPESVIVFTILILITAVIGFTAKEEKNVSFYYIVGFGLICGFALATKISTFPILIIPFILISKLSKKIIFGLITIIAFFVFVFPAISTEHSYKFLNWIRKLIMYSGKYGGGEKNYVNFSDFFVNLKTIFLNETVFSFSYIIITLSFFLLLIPGYFKKIKTNRYLKFLFAIYAVITVQTIIVCKHFELHYLIPAQLLIVPGLFVINKLVTELFPFFFQKKKTLYLFLILILFTLFQLKQFYEFYENKAERDIASANLIKYMDDNCKECVRIFSYGVSSREEALFIGSSYGGSKRDFYFSILKNKFPNSFYYDKWSKNIVNIDNTDTTKKKFLNSNKILFLCNDVNILKDFLNTINDITNNHNLITKIVYSNFTGETIYEIEFI